MHIILVCGFCYRRKKYKPRKHFRVPSGPCPSFLSLLVQYPPGCSDSIHAMTAFIVGTGACRNCCSGSGVNRLKSAGSFIRDAMRSGIKSGEGERDRTGYSAAGVARSKREVVGCGEGMVEGGNSSVTMVVGIGLGPVRTLEGRICSKPWARATCSMFLKY